MNTLASALTEILPATILLLVVVIVGGIVILQARNMLKRSKRESLPFTLSQLHQLHKKGDLSDDEFERAKSILTEAALKE